MEDNIIIRDFMFCLEHGCELCNKCYCDHRLCNNIRISDELSAALPGRSEEDLMDRPPISDVLTNAVKSRKSTSDGYALYECKKHATADCSICFDWAKVVVNNTKRQAKSKNPNAIVVNASREEKLRLLASMGVELSPNTRLPEDAIDKKVRSAIDASQSFTRLVVDPPFDPSPLPLWKTSTAKKSLLESVRRGSIAEALANSRARSQGRTNDVELYVDPFMDARQTLMSLANTVDQKNDCVIIQDKETNYAICIRVVEVRTLPNAIPVFVVLYGRGTRNSPLDATIKWVQEIMTRKRGMPQIVATPEEQNFLLTILNMNAKRLSSAYRPKRSSPEATFSLSFFLPIGPLNQQDVGRLSNHTGCVVCGKKATSRCSQCLSTEYCGAECQRLHWKEHKPMCNSLKGGEWTTITMSMEPEEARLAAAMGQPLYMARLNHMTSDIMSDAKKNTFDTDNPPPPPPNVHGESPFLIKMQKGRSIMIYDRQRTIQTYLLRDVDPQGYDKTMAQMHTGFQGLKVYRWAKRTGEMQLSVCLNKAPLKDPQW